MCWMCCTVACHQLSVVYKPSTSHPTPRGLTTLSQSNLLKLDTVQNEAMRVILGTTKDTLIETMRYLLDLPSVETRHKVEQGKAYLNAKQNPKNPLHVSVQEEKGCRLARDMSWMGQAEQSIQHVYSLAELKQVRDWEKRPAEFQPYYKPRHALPCVRPMASWKSRCRSTNTCQSQQQAT